MEWVGENFKRSGSLEEFWDWGWALLAPLCCPIGLVWAQLRAVLDALLEGKAQWGENLQVSGKGCQRGGLVKAYLEAMVEHNLYS